MAYANPVILYTFDSSGTNFGSGGSKYDASFNGSSVIDTTNKFIGTGSMYIAGGASQLSGTEINSVEIRSMDLATAAFTISFWMKMNISTSGNARLFHSYYTGGQYLLWTNGPTNTTLTLFPPNQNRTPTIAYNNTGFHHFVMTYSALNHIHTLYIDNNYNTTWTTALSGNFTKFRIGGALGQTDPTIGPGNVDDFRFYNYKADATFVSYLYKLGSNTNIASLSGVATADLVAAGASVSQLVSMGKPTTELIAAGYTTRQLLDAGVSYSELIANGATFNWLDLSATSNIFNQTYVNNFIDLSGSLLIRNDGALIASGDVSFNNITVAGSTTFAGDMTLKSKLFIGNDISVNGNLYVGGDLSVNGIFSGNFASGIIPTSAIINYPSSGSSNVEITGNVRVTGDASFNGTNVELSTNTILQVNGQVAFTDGTSFSTYDNNILSGTVAQGNVIFKDSTFAQVTCTGPVTAGSQNPPSDYRLKTNVTNLDGSYTIDNLEPIQYNNILSNKHEFGLIAHELQAVYPELVKGEKDGAEYQRVNYNGLIGVLVKEVQEIKRRIKDLYTPINQ